MDCFDVIVVGGGASGLMCAAVAAQWGKKALVIERNAKLGRKILASGGGNCNFTNLDAGPEDYRSQNPHFCKSALSRYPAQAFIELVQSYGVKYYEKKLGQLFCHEGAQQILELLVDRCKRVGVQVLSGREVQKVTQAGGRFQLVVGPDRLETLNLVMATGGLSFKGLGATDFGFRVAAQFGLARVATAPALVPWLFGGYHSLAGLSLPVQVTLKGQVIHDDLLFTHRGVSGPAVLKASLYWEPGDSVTINFLPDINLLEQVEQAKRKGGVKTASRLLSGYFPTRFVDFWLEKEVVLPAKDLQNFNQLEIQQLVESFHQWRFVPQGTEGYKKAEVTVGGVDTQNISSKTMEAKAVQGLYFIGELLDVTGSLGGYNFQWAWASGHAAGEAIAAK